MGLETINIWWCYFAMLFNTKIFPGANWKIFQAGARLGSSTRRSHSASWATPHWSSSQGCPSRRPWLSDTTIRWGISRHLIFKGLIINIFMYVKILLWPGCAARGLAEGLRAGDHRARQEQGRRGERAAEDQGAQSAVRSVQHLPGINSHGDKLLNY